MDYNLDKQLKEELKDAGFGLLKMPVSPYGKPEIIYYTPTLSELIEACGAGFGSLEQWGSYSKYTNTTKKWCAWGSNKDIFRGGDTPEEAVARLWLALNPQLLTKPEDL